MRLIDADALIETIEKYKFGAISSESEREYTREIMLCFVNGSPTAYDVEKVVAEIRNQPFGNYGVQEENEIIDIVRKGGAE